MRAILAALLLAATARADAVRPADDVAKEAGAKFDYALWDQLLRRYVDDQGRVDYARLRATPDDRRALEKLYAQVAANKTGGEAFYIDAYNVIVWKNVVDNQPKAVNEGMYRFFRRDYLVAGSVMDLDTLEKKLIRPTFKDARVHMALNCASGGCPMLASEAFTPDKLQPQLEREARKFCNEPRNVSWDPATRTVKLSKIFDWYDQDFDDKRVIAWINRYRTDKIPEDAKKEFVDYDWRLNDPLLPR